MSYQSEITVLIERAKARKISKHLAGCGFVTHIKEVSQEMICKVDQFRIVVYHPDFKEYICKVTGYDMTQFVDKDNV
jgi:hypothetical protein